jgi:hypothetical protein
MVLLDHPAWSVVMNMDKNSTQDFTFLSNITRGGSLFDGYEEYYL